MNQILEYITIGLTIISVAQALIIANKNRKIKIMREKFAGYLSEVDKENYRLKKKPTSSNR